MTYVSYKITKFLIYNVIDQHNIAVSTFKILKFQSHCISLFHNYINMQALYLSNTYNGINGRFNT